MSAKAPEKTSLEIMAGIAPLAMIHRNPEAKIRRFALRPYDTAGFVHYSLQEDGGTPISLFKA